MARMSPYKPFKLLLDIMSIESVNPMQINSRSTMKVNEFHTKITYLQDS